MLHCATVSKAANNSMMLKNSLKNGLRLYQRTVSSTQQQNYQQEIVATGGDGLANKTEILPKTSVAKSNLTKPFKSPLTDTFGRHHTYLRISLTERCNLRCTYCMPSDGVPLTEKSKVLTNEEIYYLAKIFVQEGVRKIRLTGGEPTVRKDIVEIIANLKKIDKLENVGITTNGLMLTRLLVPMQRAGLDAINISLDTLKTAKYEQITRRKGWDRALAGIDLAVQLDYKPKVNCVVMKGFNDNEICDFVEMTKDKNVDIRFIEYMPFTGNKWDTEKMVSFSEMLTIIKQKYPSFHSLPNGPNDTSKAYAVPGYAGQIGFITSMTEHFCGSCNRLRLTADGNLKVCLFGNTEVSLRDAIRGEHCSADNLTALISAAVKRKKKQHAGTSHAQQQIPAANLLPLTRNLLSSVNRAYQQHRYMSSDQRKLTHIDKDGKAHMVDVGHKQPTKRTAVARAVVYVGPEIAKHIQFNTIAKGDVLSISQLAGIIAAKRTSELIPLCHNIPLTSVNVEAKLDIEKSIISIHSTVKCEGKTGVEMEALTAVATAALTIYDMCKALSQDIVIRDVMLLKKSGGKINYQRRNDGRVETEEPIVLKYNTEPIILQEPYVPSHI